MYLIVEENRNCSSEERVFASIGPKKEVKRVQIEKQGLGFIWCDATGVDENGAFVEAAAQQVEDSSDGVAWLVMGGAWGLRFRPAGSTEDWSLDNTAQWGAPFLVLDSAGREIQFK